jgi:hypothetical protein
LPSIMKQVAKWAVLLEWVFVAAPLAEAQCSNLVCSVTVSLQSDASGRALGGSGTAMASMAFTTVQAYGGTVPTGVTKSLGTTNFTVGSPFDIKIGCTSLATLLPCTLLTSANYTLTAQLQSSDSTNTWKIGSSTLSSTSPLTLTTTGTYSAVVAYNLSIIIPFTESAGTISNTINFVIIAN